MSVTVKQVIEFYSKQPYENAEITKKYIDVFDFETEEIGTNKYIPLAHTYTNLINLGSKEGVAFGAEDDKAFCRYLMGMEQGVYTFTFDESNSVSVETNPYVVYEGKWQISQKWHLLIAVYAYMDAVKNEKVDGVFTTVKPINYEHEITQDKNGPWRLASLLPVSCRPLKLWMAEAAVNFVEANPKLFANESKEVNDLKQKVKDIAGDLQNKKSQSTVNGKIYELKWSAITEIIDANKA